MELECPSCGSTDKSCTTEEGLTTCKMCGTISDWQKPPESYWCKNAPNVPRVWSSSSLATIGECPRKFELKYVEGWEGREDNLDFAYGSAFHSLMEHYWGLRWYGADHQKALDSTVYLSYQLGNTLPPVARPKQAGKTQVGLTRSLVWYFEVYNDSVESLVPIGRDNEPGIELHFNFALELASPDGDPYLVQGYLDSIRVFQDVYTVWDYKTTAGSISEFFAKKFEIDVQNHIYTIAARVLTEQKFTCFMADICATAATYSDFHRVPITLTEGDLSEALDDIHAWIKQAEIYAEQSYYPKNTKACTFCDFNQICNKDPQLRYSFLKSDFKENRRKFLEARNK